MKKYAETAFFHKVIWKIAVSAFFRLRIVELRTTNRNSTPNSAILRNLKIICGTILNCRPEFERNLRHWSERKRFDNILTDIYDGQVWKNFKETSDENSSKFFQPEVANSNLGLMLNLDWF